MDNFIVKKNGNDEPTTDSLTEEYPFEPGLVPLSRDLLPRLPVPQWRNQYVEFLEQRLARNHRDLISHVQRITLLQSLDNTEAIFGAVVDLFITLGTQGEDLRTTMLSQVESLLTQQQRDFLQHHLEKGLAAQQPLPCEVTGSLLSKGISGTTVIVATNDGSGKMQKNPLEVARQCITEGDLTAAQAILEEALEEDPGNTETCMELLAFYREHKLRDDFYYTYAKLSGTRLATPDLWEKLDRHFSNTTPSA